MLKTFRVLLITVTLIAGCAAKDENKTVNNELSKMSQTRQPGTVRRPIQESLRDFGKLVRALTLLEDREFIVEIDFLPNDSGIQKELPADIGLYARKVLADIGSPFRTSRTLPSIALLQSPAAAALPFQQRDQLKPPYTFRLVGSLQRASEYLVVGGDSTADGQVNGKLKADIQFTKDHRRTLSAISVVLGLDAPDGLGLPGATAQYRVFTEKNERNRSLSFYLAGSGIGTGTKVVATQDAGDALYDAIGAAVVQTLGHALLIPYYRTAPIFEVDESLDMRFKDSLMRMTRSQLEQILKRYLWLDGFHMDMSSPDLGLYDRAVVAVEARSRSLNVGETSGLIDFVFDLWKNLDYTKAAERMDTQLANSAHLANEQKQRDEQKRAEEAEKVAQAAAGPPNFGWPASEKVSVLDVSRVEDPEIRMKILDLARTCTGCIEVRTNPSKTMAGFRLSAHSSEIQRALRQAPWRLDFIWGDASQQYLLVVIQR